MSTSLWCKVTFSLDSSSPLTYPHLKTRISKHGKKDRHVHGRVLKFFNGLEIEREEPGEVRLRGLFGSRG